MACVTDDERHRVAERLRSLRATGRGTTSLGHGYLWSLLWAASGEELDGSVPGDWFERFCVRLADLIEPAPTSSDKAPTDSRPNCGTAEVPTSQVPKCDRDALLDMEDEMFESATGLALISELEEDADLKDLQTTMAKVLFGYARRIREACGEVES